MKIVFFGTPEMAAQILEPLVTKVDIVAIVTKQDAAQGRSSKLIAPPVKEVATKLLPNVPIYQPAKCSTPEIIEILQGLKADLFVVVAYGEILSEALLAACPNGAINVHFSLLPKLRGAAPIQHAIINGDKVSGVSVIKLVKKMDAGDVLYAEPFDIPDTMTGGELGEALTKLGAKCLFKVLDDFEKGTVALTPQDHSQATIAPKITPELCRLDWKKPARELYNLVRALAPHPGAWCDVLVKGEKKRLKVFKAEVADDASGLSVSCGNGFLRLLTIQLEGKPKMEASDFLRGTPASQISFQ